MITGNSNGFQLNARVGPRLLHRGSSGVVNKLVTFCAAVTIRQAYVI